jgi:hypothetical protein
MKRSSKLRKLLLSKDTVRSLQSEDLHQAIGGLTVAGNNSGCAGCATLTTCGPGSCEPGTCKAF